MAPDTDPAALVSAAARRLPALAVGTTTHGGREVHLAGRQEPAAGLMFQIGSVTKVFTALLLARLAVRGEVRLDQPVAELLPDLAWPAGAPITLHELATHRAGLPRIPPAMWRQVLTRDQDPYADVDAEALARAVARTHLRGRGRRRYSNFGFGLLGHALAEHSGTSWERLLRREVTGPLGLHDTVPVLTAGQSARAATGHRRSGSARPVAWRFADAMAGCGALWSTVDDMLVFLELQLRPPEDELGDAVRLTQAHDLGWWPMPGRTSRGWFHNGGTHGFRSMAVVVPERGAGVVALTSSDRGVDGLALRVLAAVAPPDHPRV